MAVLRTECGSTTRTVDEWAAIVPAATFHRRSAFARTCPIEAAVAPRADQPIRCCWRSPGSYEPSC